jgi:hypothetical protein
MNKIVYVLGVVVLMGLNGCATKEYVRSQTDPLANRVGQLEEMAKADKAAAMKADQKAGQALDAVNKVVGDVQRADQDVKKAEAATARAEAAAAKAERSAKEAEQAAEKAQKMEQKSEKIFKLEQKK